MTIEHEQKEDYSPRTLQEYHEWLQLFIAVLPAAVMASGFEYDSDHEKLARYAADIAGAALAQARFRQALAMERQSLER